MGRRFTKSFMWYVNAALFVVVAAMFTCCRAFYTTPVTLVAKLDSGTAGITFCKDGIPRIEMLKGLRGRNQQEVWLHEQEHAIRIRRMGCDKFFKRYGADSVFTLDEEAAANCAVARWFVWRRIMNAHDAIEATYIWLLDHPQAKKFRPDFIWSRFPCRDLQDLPQIAKQDGTGTLIRPP